MLQVRIKIQGDQTLLTDGLVVYVVFDHVPLPLSLVPIGFQIALDDGLPILVLHLNTGAQALQQWPGVKHDIALEALVVRCVDTVVVAAVLFTYAEERERCLQC